MAKDIKAKKASFLKKTLKKAKKKAPKNLKPGTAAEEKAEGEPTKGAGKAEEVSEGEAVGAMTQKYANLAKKK